MTAKLSDSIASLRYAPEWQAESPNSKIQNPDKVQTPKFRGQASKMRGLASTKGTLSIELCLSIELW